MSALLRTPFFAHHQQAGARLIDFGGWEMPVQYEGILAEHRRVRASAGLFDVSHMGEVRLVGPRALEAARLLVSNDLQIEDGQAQYTAMCNERGGIVDDLIVYRMSAAEVFICVNAANRAKDTDWIRAHNPFPGEVEVRAEHDDWAQVAVQGRNAVAILQKLTDRPLSEVRNYWFTQGRVAGVDGCILARTGYTGEDGFEVFLPASGADALWPALLDAGRGFPEGDLAPIGLGARDTLRLEAKMNLYGSDMNDDTTPLEVGLGWVTKLDKPAFVGRDAILAQREAGVPRRQVCLEVQDRIARPHCPILFEGQVVGEVTSGTRSPTLEANIALGLVPAALSKPGARLVVDVRGKPADATVVRGPFYKRPY
jgi:aminomethyltransferase